LYAPYEGLVTAGLGDFLKDIALPLGIGGVCGITNVFLLARGSERLIDTGGVPVFVLSSFLRIGLFGIVAAIIAVRGPWWAMGPFFVGLFLPYTLYAVRMGRK
jgi:hypothetical protein